jgi:hypothetical protein
VLSGIYHHRVDYPGFVFERTAARREVDQRELSRAGILGAVFGEPAARREGDGAPGQKPAKEDQARHQVSKKNRGDNPR